MSNPSGADPDPYLRADRRSTCDGRLPGWSWRMALLVTIGLSSGCQPAAVKPVAVEPEPLPPGAPAASAGPLSLPPAPRPATVTPAPEPTPPARPPTTQASAAPTPVSRAPEQSTTYTGAQILDRLRADLSSPTCIKGAQNKRWRGRYAIHPPTFSGQLGETLSLMAYVLDTAERNGLPGEFALIPIVESWYRPNARSGGAPAGMWQMVPATARNHGLTINADYDGRLSPIDSTRAALRYLRTLHAEFGEWPMTVMAYNAGENKVRQAVRRSGHRFASGERRTPRGMANHTYDYVGKLRALACLVSKPDRQDLALPETEVVDRLVTLTLPQGARTLDSVAATLGMDASKLRRLNPAFLNGRVGADTSRQLLVPANTQARWAALDAPTTTTAAAAGNATKPAQAMSQTMRSHTVRSGESLWTIARRYKVELSNLRRWNGLSADPVIRPGQVLRLSP